MKRHVLLAIALLLIAPSTSFAMRPGERKAKHDDLSVEVREIPGSVAEVRVRGRIDAPPERVLAVLADVDAYKETMPHTDVSQMVKREGNHIWLYSVVDPPLASKRDYCVEITLSEEPGGVLKTDWIPANDMAPPEKKGVVRVQVNDGSWTIRPVDGGKASDVVYRLHVDPGGDLPKWIVDKANRTSVPDAFKAVRKAATSKRYANATSPLAQE